MPWLQSSTHSASGHRVRASRARRSSRSASGTAMRNGLIGAMPPILLNRSDFGDNRCVTASGGAHHWNDEVTTTRVRPILRSWRRRSGTNFERTVAANPDATRSLTWQATADGRTANSTTKSTWSHAVSWRCGIERGERVGIWAPNCPEWTIVQYATAKIGAILVNINPAYRTHELAYVLKQSGVRTLISATAFKTSDYVEHGRRGARRDTRSAGSVVPRHRRLAGPADGAPTRYPSTTCGRGWPRWTTTSRSTSNTPRGQRVSRRAPRCRIATSSTTDSSPPSCINFGPDDRLCIPVPFYHCFGMVLGNLGCTTHGATMVIPAPGFDPGLTLDALEKERCTAVYGVPTMFIAHARRPRSAPAATCHRCVPASWPGRSAPSRS